MKTKIKTSVRITKMLMGPAFTSRASKKNFWPPVGPEKLKS